MNIMSRRPSPLDDEPCRQCMSFSDYVKVAKRKAKAEDTASGKISVSSVSSKPSRPDCPLDRDELGNKSWALLHTMAAKYPDQPSKSDQKDMTQFFSLFAKFYPCDYCAEDLRKELAKDPPKTNSQDALSQWLCRLHNKVNAKLGKDIFDCSKVNERWRDGWLDGSCDV